MEKREILLDNHLIEYTINYKNIKKCYLKVNNGQVVINTNPYFGINNIEKFIRDNSKMVLSALDSYLVKYDYQDNGFVYIFNQRYRIVLKDMNIKKCVIHESDIYVYHHNIQGVIEAYLRSLLFEYLDDRIDDFLVNDFNLDKPDIEIKRMKIRWGACFNQQNKVCFNLVLAHLDKELIDYVITHEMTHFLQPNHSKYFYLELAKRMPDYKLREKKLKEVGI